ncbi:MAG: diguanylate cyclase domain-containing protein [Burkholderiaceae bacterium]
MNQLSHTRSFACIRTMQQWFAFCVLAFAMLAVAAPFAMAADSNAAVLRDDMDTVQVWPVVTVLADPTKTLSVSDAIAALGKFQAPTTRYATLGVRTDAMWLRVPLKVDAASDGRWILDINYPPINLLDIYVLADGKITQQAQLGSLRSFDARPMQSRTHSMPLELRAGAAYDVLIRAESGGALIMPITLAKPPAFHAAAVKEQMLQGLLSGLALCLLIYSLVQWASLRESFFLKYGLLVFGTMMFSLLQFGIGTQFLWTDNIWMERHAAGISSLIALCGSFLFTEHALAQPGSSRVFSRVMKGCAAACIVLLAIYCLDIFDTRTLTGIIAVIGPLPSILGIPGAINRARRGDSVGFALLLAWSVYMATTVIITGVIRGQMDANFWTLHAFQIGATFDMLVFMYVLGQRTKAIRLVAQRASVERDLMHSLAITDPLTGLANRRGLRDALTQALARSSTNNLLAVYMIDVDGFKPVNDRFGHDAGDELLIHMSKRMRSTLRESDIVARLGGDEFVVVASALRTEQQAHELGTALLNAFDVPFALKQHSVQVGLTIGYAIAPSDSADTTALLQLADAAMYEGKQAGKHCLRRAVVLRTGSASAATQAV